MTLKNEIYNIVDAFLVDSDERPIEKLNRDRHLAVKRIMGAIEKHVNKINFYDWNEATQDKIKNKILKLKNQYEKKSPQHKRTRRDIIQ